MYMYIYVYVYICICIYILHIQLYNTYGNIYYVHNHVVHAKPYIMYKNL